MKQGCGFWRRAKEKQKEQKGGSKPTKQRIEIAEEEKPSRCGKFDGIQ